MTHQYWATFVELIRTPFEHVSLVWGIVPLYFALLLNEMTSGRANFRTAIQTGFSFLWAAAQWLYPYFIPHAPGGPRLELSEMPPINLAVTMLVVAFGVMALFSGIRRRYPKYCSFLGYTRFSNYFMIMIYPMQAPIQGQHLPWTWERLVTIVVFAAPIWLVLHFGLAPVRNRV
jgi:hypothetical protein